jgi:uncharacterized repeat protein (TIGR04076 family)
MYRVIAKVVSRKGTCENHKVGDEFEIGEKTPPNVCAWAYHSLFPFAQVMVHSPGREIRTKLLLPVPTRKTLWCLN